MQDWLTTEEIAQLARTSPDYIRQVLIAGKLKGQKRGGVWFVLRAEAQRWLDSRKKPQGKGDC